MINFVKKPVVIVFLAILVVGAVGGYFYSAKKSNSGIEFVVAKKSDLVQKVSVTGKIKPFQEVDLSFETSGKISEILVESGDKVNEKDILVKLKNNEIFAQLNQAKANLEAEKAELSKLKTGTREEELNLLRTKIENAERSLQDTKDSLEETKNKAKVDLQSTYKSALNSAQTAVGKASEALLTLTDIQYSHFTSNDQESIKIAEAKADAVKVLLGKKNAGRWASRYLSTLEDGVFGTVQENIENFTQERADSVLSQTLDSLIKTKNALDKVPVKDTFSSTEKSDLSTEKNTINSQISTVSLKIEAIEVQKATNAKNISTAKASVTEAENTLAVLKKELSLKEAGETQEKITAQQAKVASAKANVDYYLAKLSQTLLRSPFGGMITESKIEIGQVVTAGEVVISLISDSPFKIEANIPEVDIAKVKTGDSTEVTLDAYGMDVVFEAEVVSIDPAETVIEGVATYQTTLLFKGEDERIKSGMTANLEILTAQKENIFAVPRRAVIRKGNQKFLRVLKGEEVKEIPIKTGLRGSDGNVEIREGITEGDKVVLFGPAEK